MIYEITSKADKIKLIRNKIPAFMLIGRENPYSPSGKIAQIITIGINLKLTKATFLPNVFACHILYNLTGLINSIEIDPILYLFHYAIIHTP